MTDQKTPGGPANAPHWICQPYGRPTPSSEVSRVTGYYSVAALRIFARVTGPAAGAAEKAA